MDVQSAQIWAQAAWFQKSLLLTIASYGPLPNEE